MIPIGYMAKRIQLRPGWLKASQVVDVYSVSDCVSASFADYIRFWKHNGFWFFDSPEKIKTAAEIGGIDLQGATLFYYEAHDLEHDGASWLSFQPDSAFETQVVTPKDPKLEGFDIVTIPHGTSAGCSPLSCNSIAETVSTNAHCLLRSLEEAMTLLGQGAFAASEPGRCRIYSVSSIDWP